MDNNQQVAGTGVVTTLTATDSYRKYYIYSNNRRTD